MQPEYEHKRTNAKLDSETYGRYVITRCEFIRTRFGDGVITLEEAHTGVCAYLEAIGSVSIDQENPLVWLLR